MLLAARELTDEECAARDAAPRPGVWADEDDADLRRLTQDETDLLIRHSLARVARQDPELLRIIGPLAEPGVAKRQRGGIDSDPLVRVLARRAWGDRDERWFMLRGVRAGDELSLSSWVPHPRVHRRWSHDELYAIAAHDAEPGQPVLCQLVERGRPTATTRSRIVSDHLREGRHAASRRQALSVRSPQIDIAATLAELQLDDLIVRRHDREYRTEFRLVRGRHTRTVFISDWVDGERHQSPASILRAIADQLPRRP